jgi:hypothetical protein
VKSTLHRLIPFLSLFCSCQFRRLDSIQFLCSQAHILAGRRLETRLDSILLNWNLLYNNFARTTKNTDSLWLGRRVYSVVAYQRKLHDCCLRIHCRGNVFTESLPSNERLFWLQYSGFGRHGTISTILHGVTSQKIVIFIFLVRFRETRPILHNSLLHKTHLNYLEFWAVTTVILKQALNITTNSFHLVVNAYVSSLQNCIERAPCTAKFHRALCAVCVMLRRVTHCVISEECHTNSGSVPIRPSHPTSWNVIPFMHEESLNNVYKFNFSLTEKNLAKISRLMLITERAAVYCQNHKSNIGRVCGKNAVFSVLILKKMAHN